MTNRYLITVRKAKDEDEQSFKDHFKAAFEDIFKLTKLLCTSNNDHAKAFIESDVDDDPPWLSIKRDRVTIVAEYEHVEIHRNDADDGKPIYYDFGKRFPANDCFILAVMAIFKHHVPGAKLGKEVACSTKEFDDALLLASLVNPAIPNPFTGKTVDFSLLDKQVQRRNKDIYDLVKSLRGQKGNSKFFSNKSPNTKRTDTAAEPKQKMHKPDPKQKSELDEEHDEKLEPSPTFNI